MTGNHPRFYNAWYPFKSPLEERLFYMKKIIRFQGMTVNVKWCPHTRKSPALRWLLKRGLVRQERRKQGARKSVSVLVATEKGINWLSARPYYQKAFGRFE